MAKKAKKKNGFSNMQDILTALNNETINNRQMDDEFAESFISYSMMTILDRAIPKIDGCKPSQRRTLYDMYTLGLKPEGSYKKCARVAGDTIGRFHPHGDGSVYGALVNMVNDFDIRYPLIDGQGNFGSPDGDSAAAARYTESKLTKLGMEMLADINNDAVEMVPTFSEEENEPLVLPSKFPALLCNGATGIATGYTTEIPSHNLIEICNGIIAYLKNKDISLEEMVKDYIKGPDLPSKGYLLDTPEILELYRTGKAAIKFKAKLHIEENKDTGNNQIIITELPPDVQKPKLVKKIYDFYDIENSKSKDRKVLDVIDGSEGKDIAIIIELNKTTNPQEIIDDLYNKLSLTKSKTYIMRIVDDNQPKLLGLMSLIELYVKHRRSVIFRRSKHRLTEIENKIEILKGLVLINPHIKEVTNIIISSNDVKEAKENLIKKFNLTEKQANHILETKLRVLTRQEAGKLTNDLNELSKEKNELMTLISSDNNLDLEIIEEMEYLKKNYGDELVKAY